jgi:hypothetical protein
MSYEQTVCPNCGAQNAANRDSCWRCNASFLSPGEFVGGVATAGPSLGDASSLREARLRSRYVDGYRAASVIDGLGNVVKMLAIAIFLLALFGGMGMGGAGLLLGIVVGGVLAALFFVLGVFISAQGQVLKAMLDTAVHTSPLMSDDQKASVLGV